MNAFRAAADGRRPRGRWWALGDGGGAALLAAVGAGGAPCVEAACDAVIAVRQRESPDPAWARAYAEAYPLYRELYPALKPTVDRLPT